jgi:hypothetical protein
VISPVSANAGRAVLASQAGSMRTASGLAGLNVAVDPSHRCAARASAMRQRDGPSDAVAQTERIAPSELAHRREKDALSGTTEPASLGRWTPSAGAVANGHAAIGRAATSSSAASHRAEGLRSSYQPA